MMSENKNDPDYDDSVKFTAYMILGSMVVYTISIITLVGIID